MWCVVVVTSMTVTKKHISVIVHKSRRMDFSPVRLITSKNIKTAKSFQPDGMRGWTTVPAARGMSVQIFSRPQSMASRTARLSKTWTEIFNLTTCHLSVGSPRTELGIRKCSASFVGYIYRHGGDCAQRLVVHNQKSSQDAVNVITHRLCVRAFAPS